MRAGTRGRPRASALPLFAQAMGTRTTLIGRWGAVAFLLALVAIDLAIQPGLLSVFQLGLLLGTALTAVLIAVAQTFAVLVGGLDLSVGAILALGSVLCATFLGAEPDELFWRLPVVIFVGALAGAVNGVLIAVLKVQPVVATLGTWSVYGGLALMILPSAGGTPPAQLASLLLGGVGPIPSAFLLLAGVLVVWFVLKSSRFGLHLYAVGSDPTRARLNGVAVARVTVLAYACSGLVAVLAGVYLASTTFGGDSTVGDPYLLTSLVAVVVGGTSLAGGSGGVPQTVVGALILVFLADIISANSLSTSFSVIASSLLLLGVVGGREAIRRRKGALT